MTLEGCVVRMADTVAYIGRDIEDAILLGLIDRQDIPQSCRKGLGSTNGEIVYTLVTDLIANSFIPTTTEKANGFIGFSDRVATLLKELKDFNYSNIYLHPRTKKICLSYKIVTKHFSPVTWPCWKTTQLPVLLTS